MSKITLQGDVSGTGTLTIAAPNTNTNRTLNLPDNSGDLLTSASSLNASNLSTGTVATARLGSGTADSTTFLRGDQTWATVSVDVMATIAGASVGDVGTYAFMRHTTSADYAPGATLAGSSLAYAGFAAVTYNSYSGASYAATANEIPVAVTGSAASGTWMCMGVGGNGTYNGSASRTASLWLRIS